MEKAKQFTLLNRKEKIHKVKNNKFDLLIIGGGITGAGIALDAASRGLSVCLIEKKDFASGTSSRSTKLIHGGLRYLKQLDFKLVRDSGMERAVAYKNAPHVVLPEKMLLPIVEKGSYGKLMTSVGLAVYDRLAKVKKEERRKMLNKKQTLAIEPKLRKDILKGGGYYTEYRTDDARLTIEVIKTATTKGAICLNYVIANEFTYSDGIVTGVKATDTTLEENFNIIASQVVSATGPWSDGLRSKDNSLNNKRLHLTKGVHIVVPKASLELTDTIYFDVPGGRMIFAIPRDNVTYIGTTDTNYNKELDEPEVTQEDVDYLLNAVNSMFPDVKLNQEDIISSWAGLRPLIHQDGKSPSELSRKDEIFESETGLITIAGGKLTGYRLMAKKVTNIVANRIGVEEYCKTRNITLTGGDVNPDNAGFFIQKLVAIIIPILDIDREKGTKLISTLYYKYGSNTELIVNKMNDFEDYKLLKAEIWYVLNYESVCKMQDYFIRRSGKLLFNPTVIKSELEVVANEFKNYFNWTEERLNNEIKSIEEWLKKIVEFN